MNKKFLRALVIVLILSMTLSLFLACKEEEKEEKTTEQSATEPSEEDATTDPEEETEPEYPLGVQPEDNGRTELVILMPSGNSIEIAKEPSGERVAQAMYERNCDAEEYLNVLITINDTLNGGWSDRAEYNSFIRTDVKNEKKVDIITMQTACSFVTCAQEGLLANLTDFESFDFEAPWWVPDMVGQYGMNGNLYGAFGDMGLSLYAGMSTIYFNTKLIEAYSLESPYDMVRNNTWTLDNMIANAKMVEESIDGEYDYMTNIMGFLALHTSQRTWISALDLQLVDRDAETGQISVASAPNQKLIDVFDKFFDIFEDENEFKVNDSSAENHQAFMNGTVLYLLTNLDGVRSFRGMEDDYGLVPMPKYDSAQKNFRTNSGTLSMWALPSLATKEENELSAKLCEVLGYLGRKNVVPEYYEISLGFTYARDENVMEMLKIMREGATLRVEYVYDITFQPSIWNCLQMTDEFRHPVSSKVGTYHGESVTTWWSSNYITWKFALANLYKKLG